MNDIIQAYVGDVTKENNKQLQNIAFAHGVANKYGQIRYKKAFGIYYPISYSVTDKQIQEAKIELEKRKQAELKEYKNKLVFVNMGMSFKNKKGYINNHRVRAYFKNNKNEICFLEVGTNNGMNSKKDNSQMRCDFAINEIQPEEQYNYNDVYNYVNNIDAGKIHNKKELIEYTKVNLIKIVNNFFECSFNKIFFTDILSGEEIKKNLY